MNAPRRRRRPNLARATYSRPGHVYFVRRESDGAIKIGFAAYVRGRLRALWKQHGPLTLLGTIGATPRLEHELHDLFARALVNGPKVNGEWFRPCEELLATIELFATPSPLSPTGTE